MSKLAAFCCFVVMAVLMLNAFVGAGEKAPVQMLESYCTVCHSLERVRKAVGHKDQQGWEDYIGRMQAKGAKIDDQEKKELADWLATLETPEF